MEEEIWVDIEYSPDHQVSNLGRLRSKSRVLVDCLGRRRSWKERPLTPQGGEDGYLCIVLADGKNHWVHKIVARAFLPNPENKRCVNHKDTNKQNNVASNLEWVTYKENMQHLLTHLGDHGKIRTMKLTRAQRRELAVRACDADEIVLAAEYNVSISTVRKFRKSLGVFRKSGPKPKKAS